MDIAVSGSLSTGRHSQHSEEVAGTYLLVVCSTSASGPPSLHPPVAVRFLAVPLGGSGGCWCSFVFWGVCFLLALDLGSSVSCVLCWAPSVSVWSLTRALLCLVSCVWPLLSVFALCCAVLLCWFGYLFVSGPGLWPFCVFVSCVGPFLSVFALSCLENVGLCAENVRLSLKSRKHIFC